MFDYKKTPNKDILRFLNSKKINFIVLAGYLKLIPKDIIKFFDKRILNIHPALLPKFGGKGFYGKNVHKSVIESNELFSGITIHLVNDKYDDCQILFQKKIEIENGETHRSLSGTIVITK